MTDPETEICGRCRGLGYVNVDCPDCSGEGRVECEVSQWRRRRAQGRLRERWQDHADAHGLTDSGLF